MGASVGTWALSMEILSGLLPSNLDKLEFDFEKDLYLEDDKDLSGSWENVLLYTSSNGWDASTTLYQLLLKKATAGVSKRWIDSRYSSEATEKASKLFGGLTSKSVVGIGNDLNGNQEGPLVVPPCDFGGTDISDEEYSRGYFEDHFNAPAEVVKNGVFQVIDVGEATLVVEAIKEKFALKTISESELVEIKEIEISVTPDWIEADPEEVLNFEVTVENANDPSVEFSLYPEAGHQMKVKRISDGEYIVGVKVSSNEDDFPTMLTAESISETGLRALPDSPPRVAIADVKLKNAGITVTPGSACVKPGETEQFEATIHHPDYKKVEWKVSEGSITKDGLFTASDAEAGTEVIIEAMAAKNNKVMGVASVLIGECVCYGSVTTNPGGTITGMVTEPGIIAPFMTSMAMTFNNSEGELNTMAFLFGDKDGGVIGRAIREDGNLDSIDFSDILGEVTEKAIGLEGTNGVAMTFDNPPVIGSPGKYKAWINGGFAKLGNKFGNVSHHNMSMNMLADTLMIAPPFHSENPLPEVTVEFETFESGPKANTFLVEGKVYGSVNFHEVNGEVTDMVGTFEMEFKAYYDHFNNSIYGHSCSGFSVGEDGLPVVEE